MSGGPFNAYCSEVSPPKWRGTLITSAAFFYYMGFTVVNVVGALVHWRVVAWATVPLCLIPLGLVCLFATESPLWLAARGRDLDAHKSLTYLSRASKQPRKVEQEFETLMKMQKEVRGEHSNSYFVKLVKGLLKPTGYKPFLIIIVLLFLHEYSGTYILMFYTVNIFQDLGTTMDPYVTTVGSGILRCILVALSSLILRRFGRRQILVVSATGMAVMMFLAGFLKMEVDNGTMAPNVGPIVCLLLYTIFNGCGMLNIPWMMPSELFPVELKGVAEGLMYALSNLLMSSAVKAYPFMAEFLGGMHRVLWLFAAASLAAAIFVYVFIPETHNKTLAEIREYFTHNTVYLRRKKERKEENPEIEIQ